MKWLVLIAVLVLVYLYRLGIAPEPTQQLQVDTVASREPITWAEALAMRLGNDQPTTETVQFLEAWARAEGGTAAYNPFNTTEPMPGATEYNSVGVKNYATAEDGLNATVETLMLDYPGYSEIVAGIQTNDVGRAYQGLQTSPWGTNTDLLAEVYNEGVAVEEPVQQASTGTKSIVTEAMTVCTDFYATGDVWASIGQVGGMHWGTDYCGAEGTPVYAPFDMTLYTTGAYGPGATAGQYIQGTLVDGYVIYLGHLEGLQDFTQGQEIAAGTLLGFTNQMAHTHVQLAPPGNYGPCAQTGTCTNFEEYYNTH